jgi:hypothetical protein
VTRLKWKLVLVLLEIVLILTEDRCTVCVECIILDATDELLGDMSHLESHFFLFGDSASVSER